jgi:hypothetical protein
MGGRLFIFSAYTPLNFSVLGVGADPFTTSLPEKFSDVFEIHLMVNRQNVFLYRNDDQVVIRDRELWCFK